MNILFERWRNQYSTALGTILLDTRPDDVYLAAFPRSGSTWLRTMLATMIWPNEKLEPDLYNSRIPAVSIRNSFLIRKLESPRLIMTHGLYQSKMPRAIYIVRDGRDALVSLYHYMITRTGKDTKFKEFYQLYDSGVYGKRWDENVQSWLGVASKKMQDDIHVVHFEMLKSDTKKCLIDISKYLGIDADDDLLERAINLSSIQNMKKVEILEHEKELVDNASFYRGGKTGQWHDYLVDDLLDSFYSDAGKAMQLASYSF